MSKEEIPLFANDKELENFTKRYHSEFSKYKEANQSLEKPMTEEEISARAFEKAKAGLEAERSYEKYGLNQKQDLEKTSPEKTRPKTRDIFRQQRDRERGRSR